MKRVRRIFAGVGLLLVAIVAWKVVPTAIASHRFHSARERQWASITSLGNYPPPDVSKVDWENALGTTYNVWGNVLYMPGVVSPELMASLEHDLDEIVEHTTTDNSVESVDRVFALLLTVAANKEFVQRYREAFPHEVFRHQPKGPEELFQITPQRVPMRQALMTYCIRPQDVHGPHADAAEILVYGNSIAIEYRREHPHGFDYPIGSKFVKEKFSQPADTRPDMATIMERRDNKGDVSDWRFAIVSLPDKIELPMTGRVTCAGCHQDYKDTGYVSNDSENALKQYLKIE